MSLRNFILTSPPVLSRDAELISFRVHSKQAGGAPNHAGRAAAGLGKLRINSRVNDMRRGWSGWVSLHSPQTTAEVVLKLVASQGDHERKKIKPLARCQNRLSHPGIEDSVLASSTARVR